jgi:hypothetical protein
VDATFAGTIIYGKAITIISFDEFSIKKPMLAFILSVEDEIRLDLEFQATTITSSH